jgi:hypothetical protein
MENRQIILLSFLKNWAQLGLPYCPFKIASLSLHPSLPTDLWLAGLFIMAIKFFCFLKGSKTKLTYHLSLPPRPKAIPSKPASNTLLFHNLVITKETAYIFLYCT